MHGLLRPYNFGCHLVARTVTDVTQTMGVTSEFLRSPADHGRGSAAGSANNKGCPTYLDAPSRGMPVSHAGGGSSSGPYCNGARLPDLRPPNFAAGNDGISGVVDVGWAIREADDERGSAVSHMEHARGHPGLLMGGCNESPARSSATQACQVSHMEHVTPPREPNVGGMLCRM